MRKILSGLLALTVLLYADIFLFGKDGIQIQANRIIGINKKVILNDKPVFYNEKFTFLPFEAIGAQGKISGYIVLQDKLVSNAKITRSREGLTFIVFNKSNVLNQLLGQSIANPIRIDAVTGASISTQVLNDSINERIQDWKKYAKSNDL
ncbi:MAG: hypothetical protein GXP22_10750 [Gammaproteobacteria bacterium]|nr:hypothetical protein [Gammaproteobacteria bacterium]